MTMAHGFKRVFPAVVIGVATIGTLVLADTPANRSVNGTIWVANRGLTTPAVPTSIRGFDADTGAVVNTIQMTAGSQAGDLAYAKGKLYVAEEMGSVPAIAVVDAETGLVITRIFFPSGYRPHHVHASSGGNLVAVGLYGTPKVAVVDTRDDSLIGPWDIRDPQNAVPEPRVHAGVFSQDGNTLYLASDASSEIIAIDPRTGAVFWRMLVPGAHELVVTHNNKTAYVSRRTANRLAVIDLENQTYHDVLTLGMPDTLRLSANEKLLTVGLRTMPAQMAVVDTTTLDDSSPTFQLVNLSLPADTATTGGHQWTSPSGRYTFASYEGTNPGVAVIDHTAGNTVVQRLSYPGRPHGVTHANP
jgi:outer membrane protein assembly factor BamB